MAKLHLTDRALRSLATERRQQDFYDLAFPAFGVRVSSGGRKTFFVRYRASGRQRRFSLGTYPSVTLSESRTRARAVIGDLAKGEDPSIERRERSSRPTFGEVADAYLERHARPRKRSWREDRRMLDKDVLPTWSRLRAEEISRGEVVRLLDRIVDRGAPVMANRTLNLLRKVFNFALSRDLVSSNPCLGVDRPAKEESRTRVLTCAEIRRLWEHLDREHPVLAAAFRLLLLTAQRSGEVLRLKADQIDEDRWTIPPEVRKNGHAHVVPLSKQARAILHDLGHAGIPLERCPWLLPSPRTLGPMRPSALSHAAARIRGQLSFNWTPHDLRRTAATYLPELGVDRFTVARVLGHTDGSVTATYDRFTYLPQKRRALEAWGARVHEIVGPPV